MPIGIFALSLAAFAVGTSEFIIAGLLPNIASDFGVSIPATGLLVTVYAFSVAIGGPFFAMFTSRVRRKPLIVFLLCIFVFGQAFCALAPSYAWLMAGRVFTACTHGLFFGAGGVAAMKIVGPQRRSMAMALFLGGITVASLFGMPAGSAIGNAFGWRWTFCAVGLCGIFAGGLVWFLLPPDAGDSEKGGSLKAELRALNHHQVYLSYLVIALVMVGALAFATYQVPALIAVSGVAQDRTPLYLMISGVGAIIGIYAGGRAGDWNLMPSLMAILLAQVGAAALLWLVMPHALWMAFGMFISSAASWALNAPVQSRILSAAHSAPQLASTLISTAYNLGIGGGAWVGALCIDGGLGYQTLPIVGAVCSFLAVGVAAVSWMLDGREGAGRPVTAAVVRSD
jgi:DHA1 family inner membrane transport protein